tara:strand:- start:756 stop:1688 length:933 start_codon:yes stop_codon:yes gene_type:complete
MVEQMKIIVFHQPFPMGNYKYNTAIASNLSKNHDVYLLEQLNGRPVTPEYIQQVKELEPDVVYFDMLDSETFKVIEELDCKKVLGYVTRGILNWDEIFDYQGKWYTHVFTNSLSMYGEFNKRGIPTEHFEWFLNAVPEEEMVFEKKYNHDCTFLGMGFTRVTNEEYQLERDTFFNGFPDIDFKIYGNGWPNLPYYNGLLPADDIGKLYSSAKSGIGIIEREQREKGMINNRFSEMGSCGVPIVSYNYDTIDWFGAEKYINFISNKQEAFEKILDILSNEEKYKKKSEDLKQFTSKQHEMFFEKLFRLIER